MTMLLLAAALTLSFLLPDSLTVPTITAAGPDTVRLAGTVRDFRSSHPDFDVSLAGGYGHVADTVDAGLGADGRPVLSSGITDFAISEGRIIPNEPFAARISVLGAAYGQYPITTRVTIGSDVLEPFGPYADCQSGDVNDDDNPRHAVYETYPAGTPISVAASGWTNGMNCSVRLAFDSSEESPNVLVLRNGDPVPDIDPFGGQEEITEFLDGLIDTDAGIVSIQDNQVILLYELYTTDLDDPEADFQDVVILVSLARNSSSFVDGEMSYSESGGGYEVLDEWTDSEGRSIPPQLYRADDSGLPACVTIADTAGTAGDASTGGVSSGESFSEWFHDKPGVNMSARHDIVLTDDGTGVYTYATDAFYPIDGRLFGNEGEPHNSYFTYSFSADFVYNQCAGQFIEFEGGDGAWVFIDGKLVMDLGGVDSATKQYLDLDRLGLTDGETYVMTLFYAHRLEADSVFRLRTSLDLAAGGPPPMVSAMFD